LVLSQIRNSIKENKERAIAEEKKRKREEMEKQRKASGKGKSKFSNQPPPQVRCMNFKLIRRMRDSASPGCFYVELCFIYAPKQIQVFLYQTKDKIVLL